MIANIVKPLLVFVILSQPMPIYEPVAVEEPKAVPPAIMEPALHSINETAWCA